MPPNQLTFKVDVSGDAELCEKFVKNISLLRQTVQESVTELAAQSDPAVLSVNREMGLLACGIIKRQ
jgi:hypothetical protein